MRLNAAESAVATQIRGIRAYNPAQLKTAAASLAALSRPSMVRVGLETCKDDLKEYRFSSHDRLAHLFCSSKDLYDRNPATSAWTLDQISRAPQTDQGDFTRALSVIDNSSHCSGLTLNLARIHSCWNIVLNQDNLPAELEKLHGTLDLNITPEGPNHLMWAALAQRGPISPNFAHEISCFTALIRSNTFKFGEGLSSIGMICNMIRTYGGIMSHKASLVKGSDASEADQNMAQFSLPVIDHMLGIVNAYREYTPTEVLVYSSSDANPKPNIDEAIRCLFQEDDTAAAFGNMMERADKRLNCPGGTQSASKWHPLFKELQTIEKNEAGKGEQEGGIKALNLFEFGGYRTVAGYLAYNGENA